MIPNNIIIAYGQLVEYKVKLTGSKKDLNALYLSDNQNKDLIDCIKVYDLMIKNLDGQITRLEGQYPSIKAFNSIFKGGQNND